MTNLLKGISIFLIAVLFVSCFSDSKQKELEEKREKEKEEELTKGINDALKNLEDGSADLESTINDVVKSVNGGEMEDVEVISFRDMKDFMPKRAAGMKLQDTEGNTSGAFGFKASTLTGKYFDEDEPNRYIKIEFIDTGGLGKTFLPKIPWATMEVDKETSRGYERTTEIDGYKAFEEYDNKSEKGSVSLFAGERFIIKAEGRKVKMKDIKNAIDDVPVKKLIKKGKKK